MAFAINRNPTLSFPYLKENGELLRIAVDTGFLLDPRAVELYDDFYKSALKLTEHYPQYFRFILGIVIDLEKGGKLGNEAEKLADYVCKNDLVLFDMCETRKLETLSMLQEVTPLSTQFTEIRNNIIDNVDRLVSNPDLYTKFNKPLFYELTHIIFFLTQYGKEPIALKNDVVPCLLNMGLLCLLDNDADLLAEICICLDYVGVETPEYWDVFLQRGLQQINIHFHETVASALNPAVDEYHVYFVLNWYQAIKKRPSFQTSFKGRTPSFSLPPMPQSILSKLSDFSHQFHFNGNKDNGNLASFVSGLNNNELEHWNKILISSPKSHELIQNFSGMRNV